MAKTCGRCAGSDIVPSLGEMNTWCGIIRKSNRGKEHLQELSWLDLVKVLCRKRGRVGMVLLHVIQNANVGKDDCIQTFLQMIHRLQLLGQARSALLLSHRLPGRDRG